MLDVKATDQCDNCGREFADHVYVPESLTDYRCPVPHQESGYGGFCGGDPRKFHPDGEVCTPEEIENHRKACALWDDAEDRGAQPTPEKLSLTSSARPTASADTRWNSRRCLSRESMTTKTNRMTSNATTAAGAGSGGRVRGEFSTARLTDSSGWKCGRGCRQLRRLFRTGHVWRGNGWRQFRVFL